MFKNLYRTNQLTVEANAKRSKSKVVIFIVNVRLVDRNVKSHAGSVKVTKVMVQYNTLGTIVKTPSKSPPSILRIGRACAAPSAAVEIERVTLGLSELMMAETFANGALEGSIAECGSSNPRAWQNACGASNRSPACKQRVRGLAANETSHLSPRARCMQDQYSATILFPSAYQNVEGVMSMISRI